MIDGPGQRKPVAAAPWRGPVPALRATSTYSSGVFVSPLGVLEGKRKISHTHTSSHPPCLAGLLSCPTPLVGCVRSTDGRIRPPFSTGPPRGQLPAPSAERQRNVWDLEGRAFPSPCHPAAWGILRNEGAVWIQIPLLPCGTN